MASKKKTPTWQELQKNYTEDTSKSRKVTEDCIMDICMKYRHFHGAKEHARRDLADILYNLALYYQK